MKLRSMLVAAGLALLAGCSLFGSSSRKLPPLPEFVPGARLAIDWQTSVAGAASLALVPARVAEGAAVVAGADGVVERLDGGRRAWRVELGAALAAGVGSDGKLAVVVTRKGEAVALSVADGSVKWRAPVGAEVLAPPAVSADAVAIRASDSRVFGFSAESGKRTWVFQRATPPLSLRSYAGLLTQDKVAVAGFPGGKMVAINLANGGALWELTVAIPKGTTELERVADVVGTPVLKGRELCAVAYQGRTVCFDASSGNLIWSREISSASGLDRDASKIYLTDAEGAIQALDAGTGASVWKQDKLVGRGAGRPLRLEKYLVVVDAEGYVSVLHPEDGSLLARQATDGSAALADPVAIGQNTLLLQTVKGGIFALTAQ